jgi:hypothetical protein
MFLETQSFSVYLIIDNNFYVANEDHIIRQSNFETGIHAANCQVHEGKISKIIV